MYVAIRIGLSWLIGGILVLDASVTKAEMFKGYPDAIICNEGAARVVAYISAVMNDGSAVYTLAQGSAKVTPDNIFHRKGVKDKDCDGKSLDQLEKDGQTRMFH